MTHAPIRSKQNLTPGDSRKTLQVVMDEDDFFRFKSFADSLGWSTSSLARRAFIPYIINAPRNNTNGLSVTV